METILSRINGALWSMPLVILVLGAGVYFTFRMKFPQFRYMKETIHKMGKGSDSNQGLSPVKSFIFTAARTVGVGNIAGMAAAIYFGGPGAVLWLWILAIFGSGVAMVEAILSQTYRVTVNGEYRGGPAFYLEKGMKNRKLGKIFAVTYAVITFVSIVLLMPGVQSYNIAHGLSDAFGMPIIPVGSVFALVLGFTIFGGLKRLGNAAQKISPIMAALYVVMSLIIIIINIKSLPAVISLIFKSAFGADQVFAGITGATISWGIKRGVFANEVGIGTSAITGAVGEVPHPVNQGLANGLSVFIGTFFVCTTSAIMMLMTGCYNVVDAGGNLIYEGLPGVDYGNAFISSAIDTVIPGLGAPFVAIAILCFAFVALLAYYLYAESNMVYLVKDNKTAVLVLRVCFVISIFIGSVLTADTVWTMGDMGNALMAWINVCGLILIGNSAVCIFRDYDRQRKNGVDSPCFDVEKLNLPNASEMWRKNPDKQDFPQRPAA